MPDPATQYLKAVSTRLLAATGALVAALLLLFVFLEVYPGTPLTLPVVFICGALGAFVSVQRRLRHLSQADLILIKESLPYAWLAPAAGAVLAGVLYLVFISGLIEGTLFPKFTPDTTPRIGLAQVFQVTTDSAGYAKLMFWSFVAGFSERFVTDIIGRFHGQAEADHPRD